VDFEWDDDKERANRAKHSISFGEAIAVFADAGAVTLDASRPMESLGSRLSAVSNRVCLSLSSPVVAARRESSLRDGLTGRRSESMTIVKARLDLRNPPLLSKETKGRLDKLQDEELTANAESDPDNPPLTESELERLAAARAVRRTRAATGLSQSAFAKPSGSTRRG
jgi:uncharacterized DUF497 family protein